MSSQSVIRASKASMRTSFQTASWFCHKHVLFFFVDHLMMMRWWFYEYVDVFFNFGRVKTEYMCRCRIYENFPLVANTSLAWLDIFFGSVTNVSNKFGLIKLKSYLSRFTSIDFLNFATCTLHNVSIFIYFFILSQDGSLLFYNNTSIRLSYDTWIGKKICMCGRWSFELTSS